MTKLSDLKTKLMEDPEFRKEYEALAPEFELSEMLISMRKYGRLTQEQMAERLRTTQSAVARLESGRQDPKLSMLRAYADAAGVDLVIEFRPRPDNPDAQTVA
ncbi:transcriptional regulator with XRE-family HTH domain [Azospirillum sp. OGB3]|uniref:helix-turn-helix domain-containing protein n=1 Tax=Azospirillum sp. OGB3 TaxID=2587012 RepID=UPI001606A34D|nr:helix-turn-helix transcriptional regulator [Azospirillum sp. OGB3]MBB3268380.1 transcriptional regulator with XRE-family HTH domain [Azospirillum sp. OGB3]